MTQLTAEQEALWRALRREPEPEAHCYECPNRHGKCLEYSTLNPQWLRMGLGYYDRGCCHWGYETIQKTGDKEETV